MVQSILLKLLQNYDISNTGINKRAAIRVPAGNVPSKQAVSGRSVFKGAVYKDGDRARESHGGA